MILLFQWAKMDWTRLQCPQFGSTYRTAAPLALRHGGCKTRVKKYWRYCGMCPTKCCYPIRPTTRMMDMICSGGQHAVVKVMQFSHCQCTEICSKT